jgi:sulfur relay (sulfurtransferase) complex TusBCD TusD component (DsrE family)
MTSSFDKSVLLITGDGMGSGDPALRGALLEKYLRLLLENKTLPAAICLYTDGVRLVCRESGLLEILKAFETAGVRLVVCSTCLNHFGLAGSVRAGIVGGMADIIEAQLRAEKVVTL